MEKFKILGEGHHNFEVVTRVPKGFFVWNISSKDMNGYLPLCEWLHPEDENDFWVNPETIKCIRTDDYETILNATSYGAYTPEDCKASIAKLIKRSHKRPLDKLEAYDLERLEKALPALERLEWE